jgi:hypothetical protein
MTVNGDSAGVAPCCVAGYLRDLGGEGGRGEPRLMVKHQARCGQR